MCGGLIAAASASGAIGDQLGHFEFGLERLLVGMAETGKAPPDPPAAEESAGD